MGNSTITALIHCDRRNKCTYNCQVAEQKAIKGSMLRKAGPVGVMPHLYPASLAAVWLRTMCCSWYLAFGFIEDLLLRSMAAPPMRNIMLATRRWRSKPS